MIAPPTYRPLDKPQRDPHRLHWAWVAAAVVLVPLVYLLQQFTLDLRTQTLARAPDSIRSIEEPEEPGISQLTLAAKFAVQVAALVRRLDLEVDDEDLDSISAAGVERHAVTRAERLRVAIVAGELEGKQAALSRLAELEKEAERGGALAGDLYWLGRLYREGPDALTAEAKAALVDRHGWFGRLALVHGLPDSQSARFGVLGGGHRVLKAMRTLGQAQLLILVGGAGVLLVLIGMARNRVLRSNFDVATAMPVHLETFVVFVGGFLFVLLMTLLTFGMGVEASLGALAVLEVLTWGLVGVLAWPLARRVEWSRFAQDIGLHRGQGVFLEVGAGVLGWLAGVPLTLLVHFAGEWIGGMTGVEEPASGPEGYPLFQSPPGGSWGLLLLGTLSLVVWAPVVEEVMFRGVLYTFLRPRVRWFGAVLITAAVFGLVHPYTTAGLVQVAVGGVVFGLLREWRGSLIAPMVAHALHNGSIAAVTVGMVVALS